MTGEAVRLSGDGERVLTKFSERNTTGGRLVIEPCKSCAERRKEALDELQRDMAYRGHLCRRLLGLRCDEYNQCQEHEPDYEYWKPTPDFSFAGYAKLVREFFTRLRRETMRSISAVEILGATAVQYCETCYWLAIDGFEENVQIYLCNDCLQGRQNYIDRVYADEQYNENELTVPLRVVFVEEVLETEPVAPDDYYDKYLTKHFVKLGVDAETIAFGVIGSAGAIASIASAVIAIRETMGRGRYVRGLENGHEIALEEGVVQRPREEQRRPSEPAFEPQSATTVPLAPQPVTNNSVRTGPGVGLVIPGGQETVCKTDAIEVQPMTNVQLSPQPVPANPMGTGSSLSGVERSQSI
jgi:hypothetical protein